MSDEREALMELVDALESERPRYASQRVRTALALARDALCVCAETSTRNCPVHGNQDLPPAESEASSEGVAAVVGSSPNAPSLTDQTPSEESSPARTPLNLGGFNAVTSSITGQPTPHVG